MRGRLQALMMPVITGRRMPYAEGFCGDPNFINCIRGAPDDVLGSPQAPAWNLELTISQLDFSSSSHQNQRSDDENSIRWEKLPSVVERVNIDRCISLDPMVRAGKREKQPLDLSRIISRLPKTVKHVHVSRCDSLGIEQSDFKVLEEFAEDPNHYNGKRQCGKQSQSSAGGGNLLNFALGGASSSKRTKTCGLGELSIEDCVLENSFFSEKVALPWMELIGLRKFSLSFSRFRNNEVGKEGLGKLISRLTQVEELSIRENEAPLDFTALMTAVVSSAANTLKILDIDLYYDDHDNNQKNKNTVAAAESNFNEETISLQLSHLNELTALRFSFVPFTRIPALPNNLKSLSLIAGKLEGEFPDLHAFYNLEHVDFTSNDIDHIDWTSSIPSTLKRLNVAGNLLEGPKLLSDLSLLPRQLIEVNVSGNYLSGVNTMDFTQLPPRIEIFDISYNQLSGPVDISGRLPESIRYFMINDNEFTGRYDISKVPLLSVSLKLGNNDWDTLMPPSG